MSKIQINNQDYEAKTSEGLVLVYFWRGSDPVSRILVSAVEKISKEYGETLKVASVDAEEQPLVASRLGASTFPGYHIMKDGELVERAWGVKYESELRQLIEKHL
ncbi:thioredoxin family protein [Priestia megaterium]|uniref:thioredoxin family protein n=1 Tax=Priestia megaterium TaxID=1404 RepID=UPI002452E187|nr:thioredoxin family protein [Priestia megaterium]MDH3183673.1 thioredoxin family protein [Priestia megaterium]